MPSQANAQSSQPLSPAERLAKAYLVALQAHDKPGMLSILADDFVLEVPMNVSGTNDLSDSWRGMDAASANFDIAFTVIELTRLTDLEITPGQNENVAFAEARGEMRMANGRPYRNRYVFRFDVADGKIKRVREYANPITAAIAFGIPLPQSSSDFAEQFVTAKADNKS
jgi:ketosteroid isomerase-like protein